MPVTHTSVLTPRCARLLLLMTLAVPCILAHPASAQADDYQALIEEAVGEFEQGNWAEAYSLFRSAHEATASARALRGMGMASYEMREYPRALRELRESLKEPGRPLSASQREQAMDLIERAARLVGSLAVTLQPAGARLFVNNELVATDSEVLVRVGKAQLRAELAGHETVERVISVAGGERYPVSITLRSTQAAAGCSPGFQMVEGQCVAMDRDGDGRLNEDDQCPELPEDLDGFEDADGCPDPDNDGDGVADAADRCPSHAEDHNGFRDDDGCPDEAERLQVAEGAAPPPGAAPVAAEPADAAASRRSARFWGWACIIGGGAAGVAATYFMLEGGAVNDDIESGDLSDGDAIERRASDGQTANTLAVVSSVAFVGLELLGAYLVVANQDPERPDTAATRLELGPGSVRLSGTF